MSMRLLIAIGGGLATTILALGFASQSLWIAVLAALVVALGWLVSQWRDQAVLASASFAAAVGLAGLGAWLSLPAGWLLASVALMLAMWDLDRFLRQLRRVKYATGTGELLRAHMRALLLVLAIGLVLGGAALSIQIELSFGWAVLLAGVAAVGIAQIIRLVYQRMNDER